MYHLTRNIIPSLLLTFPVMVAHLDAVCINYCERIGCIFSSAQDCHNCQIMVTNHLQWHKLLQGRHFAGLIRIGYRQPHPIFLFPSDILVEKQRQTLCIITIPDVMNAFCKKKIVSMMELILLYPWVFHGGMILYLGCVHNKSYHPHI